MTNFEKMKSMSIEAAADMLTDKDYCNGVNCPGDKFCNDCAMEWLQKEAE